MNEPGIRVWKGKNFKKNHRQNAMAAKKTEVFSSANPPWRTWRLGGKSPSYSEGRTHPQDSPCPPILLARSAFHARNPFVWAAA